MYVDDVLSKTKQKLGFQISKHHLYKSGQKFKYVLEDCFSL